MSSTQMHTVETIDQLLNHRHGRTGKRLTAEEAVDRLKCDTPPWFGWKTYVVPQAHLKPYINSFERAFSNDNEGDDSHGWLMRLATEASAYAANDTKPDTFYRRIFNLRSDPPRARICSTELASALLMVGGLDLDRDTDIPTLPGSKLHALDLLYVRAEALDPNVDKRDVIRYVPTVLQLSAAIIESPELTSHLQDDAPFDCLRPWSF